MSYTDLQNRAFTQIAYMDLDEKYNDYCKSNRTKVAPLSKLLSKSQYDKLIKLGISKEEIDSWSISGVHNTNSENGFYACIIETSPNEAAVGFRGSEDMGELNNVVNDWVEADVGLVNSTCTNQQKEVDLFLYKYKDQLNNYENITMTGHSLGGNLAEYATIVSYKYGIDDNIKQCVSMDGPGFSNEFIHKYRKEIEKMSGVMYHPRWSFVGTMLNDLPGTNYRYVKVSNETNNIDDKNYNPLTRHDTKYLVYDEYGNLVEGKQDNLSKITGVISEGVDHWPQPIGNALITIVGGVWIGFAWTKDNFLDENGKITPAGWSVILGATAIIATAGITTVISTLGAVVLAVVTVLAIAVVTELVYDFVIAVVETICDTVAAIYNWTKEKCQQFKEFVKSLISNAKEWFNNIFNPGYSYAIENPNVKVDTDSLYDYASRVYGVNRRISSLDKRLDSLYWKVGLLDLWNLMQADLMTGYSWRLLRVASYLNDTASDFASRETELINML